MKTLRLLPFTLLLCLPVLSQVRQKKVSPADFSGLLKKSDQAFSNNDYGNAISFLKKAMTIAAEQQTKAMLAAMPPAPQGFTKKKPRNNSTVNPLGGAIGTVATQEYRKQSGSGNIKITATSHSPMVAMVDGLFNMAGMNPDLEIVTYGEHKAIFKKENNGKRLELQIPLYSKHFIEATATGLSEDQFFELFNQKFVDALAKTMGQ